MTEEKIKKSKDHINVGMLDWKTGGDYRDMFCEVMMVVSSDRILMLDFGIFDEEGFKRGLEGLEAVSPYIKRHTRIRVTYEHFERIVKLLNDQLKEMKKDQEEGDE